MSRNQEPNARKRTILFVFLFSLIGLILIMIGLSALVHEHLRSIGLSMWFSEIGWRLILSGSCILILLILIIRALKNRDHFKKLMFYGAGMIICIIVPVFLMKGPLLDIAYLNHPEQTYLLNVDFDDDYIGEGPARFYINGTSIQGEHFTFSIDKTDYNKGKDLWEENFDVKANIEYLPNTKTVISIDFESPSQEDLNVMFPADTALKESLNSYEIQLDDKIYTLPIPLQELIDEGWNLKEEDTKLQLQAKDQEDDHAQVTLYDDKDRSILVTIYNPTDTTIDIKEGIINHLYLTYDNLNYEGTALRLPNNLMLGWTTKDEVLSFYGTPSQEQTNTLVYDFDDGHWRFGFNDNEDLINVIVSH